MDPISSQFSHDFQKFVLQQNDVKIVDNALIPKPFPIKAPEKSKKTKKDLEKKKQQDQREKGKQKHT